MEKIQVKFVNSDKSSLNRTIEIDVNKVVEDLLFKYLDEIKQSDKSSMYHFIAKGHPLEKSNYLNQKIKKVTFIQHLGTIKARYTEKDGGI